MQNPYETPSQKSQPQQPTQSQLHCDPQEIQSSSCCSASRLGVPSPVAAAETKNPKFDLVWAPPASEVQSRSSRLVEIPAGPFLMGTDDLVAYPADHEGPVRQVQVSAFGIEKHLVTNAEFAAFVHATGYETDAERFGWSYVFGGFLSKEVRRASPKPEVTPWWRAVTGANWFYPFGPDAAPRPELFPSSENPQQVLTAAKLPDHPVVHVSWRDASAFAKWCGAELPTEEQWEKAARGGLVQARYAWGNEFMPQGADGSPAHMANIWQGVFPLKNTMEDGFSATSPVGSFPANGYGLFDMAGNVWEMTASNWDRDGSNVESGTSNFDPSTNDRIVIRGGSYLCHDSYCHRYRVSARTTSSLYDSSGNMGFRLAVSS